MKKTAKSFQEFIPNESELDTYELGELYDVHDQLEQMKINRSLHRQADVSSTDEERWTHDRAAPKKVK